MYFYCCQHGFFAAQNYAITVINLYRKFKADRIFTGLEMLDNATLVTDDAGKVIEVLPYEEHDAQYYTGILCPGLINAHCHLELSHLKGQIPRHTGLINFVQQVLTLRGGNEERRDVSMTNAHKEMIGNGIVAVGDICNTADTVNVKRNSTMQWRNFVEVSGFVEAASRKRLDEALGIRSKFDEAFIVPHSSYSVSKKLLALIADLNEKFVSIHNQESAEEDLLHKNGSGDFRELYKNLGIDISSFTPANISSFKFWAGFFSRQQNIISVHNTFIEPGDIELAKNSGKSIWFCLCPNANLYIENTIPPVQMLRDKGCPIVLGTDSYASNDALNIVNEMKTLQERIPGVPLKEMLGWATVNGAAALSFEGLGKFEAGCTPGIIAIDAGENDLLTGTVKRIL